MERVFPSAVAIVSADTPPSHSAPGASRPTRAAIRSSTPAARSALR